MRRTTVHLGLGGFMAFASAAAAAEAAPDLAWQGPALQAYRCPAVPYPMRALRLNVQGEVGVRFVVREDGRFDELTVLQSAGETTEHRLLDRASLQQLAGCRHVGPGERLAPGAYRTRLIWRTEG